MTLIALMAAICLVLLVLGFLSPRLSRRPQRGVDRALGAGARTGVRAPGRLGRWLSRPFSRRGQERKRRAPLAAKVADLSGERSG